ncbi:MAG: 1-acyl-sn-glycerol-3-phosphate acyltransferase [Bacillales bacterium]|nr:1-acyl-sn-glycerol-3-phosphate acyltransferase [Bacillales bacterium]
MFRLIKMVIRLIIFLISVLPEMKRLHQISKRNDPNDDNELNVIVKKWGKNFIAQTGSSVEIVGEELIPEGPVVFVGNHESDFDIPLLLGFIKKPFGFVAKIETKKLPLISTWMEIIRCVFMNRASRREAIASLKEAIDHIKRGHSLVIFPEGTRNRGEEVLEFKPGSLRLAKDGLAPIVPIVIYGTADIFEKNNRSVKPAKVIVKILHPIANEELQNRDMVELSVHLHATICKEREKLKSELK